MNILIVGLGSIAQKHIAALRTLAPDSGFFALRSSKDAPAIEGVTDLHDLSDAPEHFDFAIVSNPTHLHAATISSLLPLRVPLFIEKPVLLSLEGTEELERSIREAGILTYVGCHLRFHPCITYLRDLLATTPRRILDVRAINESLVTDWQPGRDFAKSFRRSAAESGGVHLELIHELDFVTWLFGMPTHSSKILRRDTDLTIDAPDFAQYDLAYPGFRASITLSYHATPPRRTLEVACDDAVFAADLRAFTVRRNDDIVYAPGGTIADVYQAQMQYFLEHIRSKTPMMNDFFEATRVLRLALA